MAVCGKVELPTRVTLDWDVAQALLQQTTNFIFDVDGFVWDANGPITGAIEAVEALLNMGKKVFFITNNSFYSQKGLVHRLQMMGFPVDELNVMTSSFAAAAYLTQQKFSDVVYCVGREKGLGAELVDHGLKHRSFTPELMEMKELYEMELDSDVTAVVVGYDPELNYMKMAKATNFLRDPERNCQLITCGYERTILKPDSQVVIPGQGAMIKGLEFSSERTAVNVGKPSPNMFHLLRERTGIDPKETLLVCDTIDTDIAFARECQLRTLLLLSGSTSEEDLDAEDFPPEHMPEYVSQSVEDFALLVMPDEEAGEEGIEEQEAPIEA